MKTNLMLIKYSTTPEKGTFQMKEVPCFFGSKMMDIEDNITINDISIQYSYRPLDGYQYYNIADAGSDEQVYILNLNDLKQQNHQIFLLQQNATDMLYNTRWQFTIDIKNILRSYLYAKLRERRTFRAIQSVDVFNKNINNSIYDYINNNMLDRYKFDSIDFYVKYENISQDQTNTSGPKLKYDPIFDVTLRNSAYLDKNINIISDTTNLENLIFNYNQNKSSSDYRYNYYFDLFFSKI